MGSHRVYLADGTALEFGETVGEGLKVVLADTSVVYLELTEA